MSLPFPLTPPDPAEQELIRHKQAADYALNAIHIAAVESFREFWYGPVAPELKLAKLDTHAATWFTRHQLTVQYLLAMGEPLQPQDYTPPADKPFTRHDDGRITFD